MKNNSLERILRQKLEDLRIEPSSQARDLVYQKIRKRGRIILYRRLSIAAGMHFIFSAGFFYLRPADRQDVAIREESSVVNSRIGNEKYQPDTMTEEITENIPEEMTLENPLTEMAEVNGFQEYGNVSSQKEKQTGEFISDIPDREPAAISHQITGEMAEPGSLLEGSAMKAAPVAPGDFPAETYPITESNVAQRTIESSERKTGDEPIKITIEYIASGSGRYREKTGQNPVRELYSKMSPEAVIDPHP